MSDSKNSDWDRYLRACHAIQTATAYNITSKGEHLAGASPKHLRVGIDTQKVEMGGLVMLLIEKGVITEAEYFKAMADAAEREKERYEREIGVKLI